MTDYGLRAPHGPDMTGTHDPIHSMTDKEKMVFDQIIHPDDIYTPEGVYWADLPAMARLRFVLGVDSKEYGEEIRWVWAMFKKDPLAPVGYYFRNMVIPGAGLGLEG